MNDIYGTMWRIESGYMRCNIASIVVFGVGGCVLAICSTGLGNPRSWEIPVAKSRIWAISATDLKY